MAEAVARLGFDDRDGEILRLLDIDSQQSIAGLAETLSVTRDQITYRIRRLEREGVITRYAVAINPYRLGFTLYKMYLSLQRGPGSVGPLIEYLKRQTGVFWIARGEGRWDLLFGAYATSAFRFSELYESLMSKFSHEIQAFETSTLIEAHFFPRKYLGAGPDREFLLGGLPSRLEFDRIDDRLFKLYANDARRSVSSLAQQMKLSATAVRHRISNLEEAGIITGYRLDLDIRKFGMESYKAQLYLRSFESYGKLRDFCRRHPNIVYLLRQLGEATVEIEVDAESFDHYQSILNELRLNFAFTVRTVKMTEQIFLWLPPAVYS